MDTTAAASTSAPDPAPPSELDTAIDDAITEVEQEFGVLFQRIRKRWKDLAQSVHPSLQPVAYKVLGALVSAGPMSAGQLAEHLALDKSVLSRQAAHLEELGLIERRGEESDRRVRLLAATPIAIERVTAARTATRAHLHAELATWPREDIVLFAQMLRKLAALA